MNSTYVQKASLLQKSSASKMASVLDSSAQSESLQRKADMANNAVQRAEAPRPNNTGMPDNLKAGIESLSGFSMDDVRVHYNSSKPATVQALAYTQGTDIHVAPGQEKHLPHEAWHVAQQMAGRVSPTTNINGMPVNDNAGLEHEADVMGEKAVQCKDFYRPNSTCCKRKTDVAQCMGQDKIEAKMCELSGIGKDTTKAYEGLCGGWSLFMLKNPQKALEIWQKFESVTAGNDKEWEEKLKGVFKKVVECQLRLSHADSDDGALDIGGVNLFLTEEEQKDLGVLEKMLGVVPGEESLSMTQDDAEKKLKEFVGIVSCDDSSYDDSKYESFVGGSQSIIGNAGNQETDDDPQSKKINILKEKFIRTLVLNKIMSEEFTSGKWLLSTDCHFMSISFNSSDKCSGVVSETNESGIVEFDSIDRLVTILVKEESFLHMDSWFDDKIVFSCWLKQVDESTINGISDFVF